MASPHQLFQELAVLINHGLGVACFFKVLNFRLCTWYFNHFTFFREVLSRLIIYLSQGVDQFTFLDQMTRRIMKDWWLISTNYILDGCTCELC